MRPNPHPAFLVLPEGRVVGEPTPVSGHELTALVVKTPEEIAAEKEAGEGREGQGRRGEEGRGEEGGRRSGPRRKKKAAEKKKARRRSRRPPAEQGEGEG